MPQSKQQHLQSVLKDYWTYHKHYYADRLQSVVESGFGAQAYLEDYRDWRFRDPNYAAALALSVAKKVCLSSEINWELILIRHGYHTSNDTSFYLKSIILALRELKDLIEPVSTDTPDSLGLPALPDQLRAAIEIATNDLNATVRNNRMEQLTIERPKPKGSCFRPSLT